MAALRTIAARQLRLRYRHSIQTYVGPRSQQVRTFFGLSQILGVIANPAETIRQLNESKDLLKKAKEDLELSNEAKQIPKKHTFSKLPGFHGRKNEQALLRKVLSNTPKMTVIFGATSVGKTALLRQVLATDDFFVIKFDLRISGFANIRTLYVALCEQFQQFFEDMHDEEMDKQKLVFKHLVLDLMEKEKEENGGYQVSVADIASLMESLQSCLLKYWEYEPAAKKKDEEEQGDNETVDESPEEKSSRRKVDATQESSDKEASKTNDVEEADEADEAEEKVFKKRPVVFLMDEAHKLPALVDDQLSLKVFLDTLLVLTKQDRLCHVVLCTSDSFFQHFLRSMNVGHHAQLLTIGDCTKAETAAYFDDEIRPNIPEKLRSQVNFQEVYDAFGGKLSHIADYTATWANADGEITPYTSPIFTQAYTMLQFHLTHTKFETFSPLSTATSYANADDDSARFSRDDLLYVMKKLVKPPYSLPYFQLCREIGTDQVDSMVKTRVLDLRWTKTVSPEQEGAERVWSKDGIERPIVLPMTRIVRKAMEVVLREDEELQKDGSHERKRHEKKSKDNEGDHDRDKHKR